MELEDAFRDITLKYGCASSVYCMKQLVFAYL